MENFHESSKNDLSSDKKSKKGKSEFSRETKKSISAQGIYRGNIGIHIQ
jgi:hypothetical protein